MIQSVDPNESLHLEEHDVITLRGVLENHITELTNKRDSIDNKITHLKSIHNELKKKSNYAYD